MVGSPILGLLNNLEHWTDLQDSYGISIILPGTSATKFHLDLLYWSVLFFFLGLKCRRKEVFVLRFIVNPNSRFQNLNPHFPIECTQPAIALTVPLCLYTACLTSSFRASSQSCARWISLLSLKLGQTVFYSNFKVCRFELFRQVSEFISTTMGLLPAFRMVPVNGLISFRLADREGKRGNHVSSTQRKYK